jgi:hypothetical protein
MISFPYLDGITIDIEVAPEETGWETRGSFSTIWMVNS